MALFKVQIVVEAVVEAENERDAQEFGFDVLGSELETMRFEDVRVSDVTVPAHLPTRWDTDTLIYSRSKEELTVGEALDREWEAQQAAAEQDREDA